MKKVAILQSNYIPWKGYFDMIGLVDEFILYDDMQYTRRDWRNRNKIKTPNGLAWLTIPVEVKGKYFQKINETIISEPQWAKDHWATIKQFYSKARFFKDYKDIFENQEQDAAFEKVKHGLDLYSFGLILYGILEHNIHIQHSSNYEKYREFVNKIYKYENPEKALTDFKSI